ncbi:hypothetical protein M1328_00430 [Patescibacteria group bacterium]|nr:hypothetical protein [Patescibacteria group bacterium]
MYSAKKISNLIRSKNSHFWQSVQRRESLSLFHQMAESVPAYKDFLKHQHISHKTVKKWSDFKKIPSISKKNYLRKYHLKELLFGGKLDLPLVYTATSGSTGPPFYFMRGEDLDWQYSVIIEQFLENSTLDLKKPILVLVCFGMGIWIGGLITYKAFEIAAKRNNYALSLITPGINKQVIFNILQLLAPQYEQLVLVGYPPFIKDIIDESETANLDLKKYRKAILFAAESISEEFRDYIADKAGIKNLYLDIMNIYGSADIGAMAYESSLSTLIRRIAQRNKHMFETVFQPINKTPTLSQYNPLFTNFEESEGEILLTGKNALPFVRYAIGDKGGVFDYDQIDDKLLSHGVSLKKEISKIGIGHSASRLPFVYIYERIDLSATFYGLWIYPEWFRKALLLAPISRFLTGKFTLQTKFNSKQDQYLEINLELKKGVDQSDVDIDLILKKMIDALRENSSEYRELSDKLKKQAWPRLKFWPNESVNYFQPGIKQKWVKRP